jgi:nitrogen regulatory protein PII
MKLITAVVKPDTVDDLVIAATDAGARGLTAVEAIGFGQQYGHGNPPDSQPSRCPRSGSTFLLGTRTPRR